MKYIYLSSLLVWVLVLGSCTKKGPSDTLTNGKVLTGVWELRDVVGGMAPYNPDLYAPGNGTLWVFKQKDFARVFKDSVYQSGTYSVSKGTGADLNTGRKIDQFIFNSLPSESFELKNDTLSFYYGAIALDGDIERYVKISDDTLLVK